MFKQSSQELKLLRFTLSRLAGGVIFVFYTRTRRRERARGVAAVLAWTMVVFGLAVINIARPAQTAAATNNDINFQARLELSNGAVAADGNYNVEFKLYNASSGGSALWTEDYLVGTTTSVKVINGYLTANLGSQTAFPTNINWDQQLWITMNIGGTSGSVVPTATSTTGWDGEMSPRLALTAVPYAFRAGQLALQTGSNESTLGFATQTTANSLLLPNEGGTLCVEGDTTNCGFAAGSGSTSYIQNGTSPQTANFNITGTGVAGILQAGQATLEPGSDSLSTPSLAVLTSTGGNLLTVAASSTLGQVGINLGGNTLPSLTGSGLQVQGALQLSGGGGASNTDTYLTPVGSSVATKINIPNYNPGAFGQVIALGIPSTAASTSRVISVFDARTSAHQPSIGVFSPDENNIVGFSWDGSNTVANVETTGSSITLDTVGTGNVGIGTDTNDAKTIQIGPNGTNTNTTTYQLGVNTGGIQNISIGSPSTSTTANSGSTVSIQGGTLTDAIQIGTTASFNSLLLGSSFGSSITTIQGGSTGSVVLDSGAGSILIGNSANNKTISLGAVGTTANTTTLNLATSTGAAQTVNAGSSNSGSTVALTGGATSQTITNAGDLVQVTGGGSTSAFSVQNATNASALTADTTNLAVGINGAATTAGFALNVTGTVNSTVGYDIAGTPICTSSGCVVATSSGILNGTSPQTANFNITGNGTVGGTLTNTGTANFQNSANSATAFQIQSAAGSDDTDSLLGLSTVYNTNNLVTNGSFEQDTNGWAANGTNSAISQVTGVGAPFGSGAMQVVTTGTPSSLAGAKFPVTMVSGDVYSMSFYVKLLSGTFTDLSFGVSNNGSTNTTCVTTDAASITDWLRFACTFTASAQSGSPYIWIGQNDTTTDRTYYIDGASLETLSPGASISTSLYKEGYLDLSGLALSNVLIQPTANSNTTLQVTSVTGVNGLLINTDGSALSTAFAATFNNTFLQSEVSTSAFIIRNNTTANPLVKADTTTIDNIDTNGSLESSSSAATGYASNGTLGTGGSVALDTTAGNAYEGSNTLKVITGASGVTAKSGAKYSMTTATFPINSSPGYSLSFYAKLPAGAAAFTTLTAGYAQDGSTNTACTLNSTTVTTYWQRFSCSFTTSASSGTPYVWFGQTDASTAHTYYIDSVQIFSAAAPVIYREGGLQFNGVITSPTTLQNTSDSANAFQVQNAGGTTTVLNADTGASKVSINGQLSLAGGLNIANLGTPAAPTVTPTCTGTCTTSYSYAVAAVNANGTTTPASTATANAAGIASLTTTNFDTVTWAAIAGASSYNIYRTASGGTPSSTGLIGNVLASNTLSFADTGIAGTGSAPTVDNSGQLDATGTALFQNATNSTTAFQIQSSGGSPITLLKADTTGTGTLTFGAGANNFSGVLTVTAAGNALVLSTAPTGSATNSLIDLGSAIASGSSAGTYIGINATSGYAGDLVNLEVNSVSKFAVTAAGDIRQGNGVLVYNTGATTPSIYGVASTMTTGDLLQERFVITSAGGFALTTPTAAAIVTAIPHATVGDSFSWSITNAGGSADTLTAGTGITLTDLPTLGSHSATPLLCVLTNVTGGSQAVTCY